MLPIIPPDVRIASGHFFNNAARSIVILPNANGFPRALPDGWPYSVRLTGTVTQSSGLAGPFAKSAAGTNDGIYFDSSGFNYTGFTLVVLVRFGSITTDNLFFGTNVSSTGAEIVCGLNSSGGLKITAPFRGDIINATPPVAINTAKVYAVGYSYNSSTGAAATSVDGVAAGTATAAFSMSNGRYGFGYPGNGSWKQENDFYLFALCFAPLPMAALCELTRDPTAILDLPRARKRYFGAVISGGGGGGGGNPWNYYAQAA